jgi:hypothetical protein
VRFISWGKPPLDDFWTAKRAKHTVLIEKMKQLQLQKSSTVKAKKLILFVAFVVLLNGLSTAQENWTPAYSDEQLDIINNMLGKWKQDAKYPVVKDIFGDHSYKPDWDAAKVDATPWDLVPDSFKDEKEARRMGCRFDYLKNTETKTGLLKFAYCQGVWLFVYDQDASGKYIRNGVITPPTWYDFASVAFVDVFGTGKPKFILIEHQGDHGTGFDEKIHWLLGWHDGTFHTVFRETVYLMIDGLGQQTYYRLNYKFVKGKTPRIETQSSYDLVCVTASPYDFHSNWRDWLFWNEKDFSFYEPKVEEEKASFDSGFNNEFHFRQNLETNRIKILELPPLPSKMWDSEEVEKYWKGIEVE